MKFILGIASVLCLFGISAAQCNDAAKAGKNTGESFNGGRLLTLPGGGSRAPQVDISNLATRQAANDQEELFKQTGPKLFDMDTALRVSERTGKPVVCWMGRHIFADPKALAVSRELSETTIQAVMDTDGETVDAKGNPLPELRVKFSDKNYGSDARTAFIPVAKLDKSSGAKILQFTRGGK